MFGIGSVELVILLVIVVVLFRASRIPELARRVGRLHPRAHVRIEPVETSNLIAAMLLLLVLIAIAVLALATPVL